MIQDRSSEGPYKDGDVIDVGGRVSKWVLNGYSEVKIANVAHAEGRKSMEKEFKELLDLANQAGNFNQDMMQWKIKFEDWKKAQGIENRIRGGQDGE